jgi:hypothetical protein
MTDADEVMLLHRANKVAAMAMSIAMATIEKSIISGEEVGNAASRRTNQSKRKRNVKKASCQGSLCQTCNELRPDNFRALRPQVAQTTNL